MENAGRLGPNMNFTDECEHVACDVSFSEPSTGIGKKILPFSLKGAVFCGVS